MLIDTVIRAARPAQKPLKLFGEKGLYLVVMPAGGRSWRFKYRFPKGGPLRKEKLLSLGSYPDVPLRAAREKRDEGRRDLANGIDPAVRRKCEQASAADTFQAVALELFLLLGKASLAGDKTRSAATDAVERTVQPHRRRRARQREPISADTVDTMKRRLELHVFPYIGACHVGPSPRPSFSKSSGALKHAGRSNSRIACAPFAVVYCGMQRQQGVSVRTSTQI